MSTQPGITPSRRGGAGRSLILLAMAASALALSAARTARAPFLKAIPSRR